MKTVEKTLRTHVKGLLYEYRSTTAACRVDVLYPNAVLIRVVMDNLGTHKPASLYEAFPPQKARRILKKLEFHFKPKHGNWLDMAEIELSVFCRKLKQHKPNETILGKEV